MANEKPINRIDYKCFYPITTRWMDNDIFGHVNNVTYYSYFDTAVNTYLIEQAGLNIPNAPIVGYVVNSSCNYLSSLAFPDEIEANPPAPLPNPLPPMEGEHFQRTGDTQMRVSCQHSHSLPLDGGGLGWG